MAAVYILPAASQENSLLCCLLYALSLWLHCCSVLSPCALPHALCLSELNSINLPWLHLNEIFWLVYSNTICRTAPCIHLVVSFLLVLSKKVLLFVCLSWHLALILVHDRPTVITSSWSGHHGWIGNDRRLKVYRRSTHLHLGSFFNHQSTNPLRKKSQCFINLEFIHLPKTWALTGPLCARCREF